MPNETQRDPHGQRKADHWIKMPLPPKGKVLTYIISSAQNNTYLHRQCWSNIKALAAHYGARIMVASFTYNKATLGAAGAKRKTSRETDTRVEWWDSDVEPFLYDKSVELAPGLIFCGELQILPTAVKPLSGLESYTGRSSSIIPHVKFAVQSVASPQHSGTKFLYTTGTVTVRNYIQKKAGQKASFHHGYGGLIVQVDHEGGWYVRQLNADSCGTIYDFDRRAEDGKVMTGHRPEAIVWGDIHVRQLEDKMRNLCWGKGGILDTLRPKCQVMHDLVDFRSQNHHDRDDSWRMFQKFVDGKLSVRDEMSEAGHFLNYARRGWCETVIVRSNHDEALDRWLKEADFRLDPENALFFLRANLWVYEQIRYNRSFNLLQWVTIGYGAHRTKFLERDEPYIVCPEAGGGIELAMHGDVGANGSRATGIETFSRTGRKCIVGHSHSAEQHEGAMRVGVMGALDQGYNEGMSSWSHTFAIVYPNGKRTLVTVWAGKERAQ